MNCRINATIIDRKEESKTYTVKQIINSSEPTISFSLPDRDWCLLQESALWGRLEKYLEACQSTDTRNTPQERAKILEIG